MTDETQPSEQPVTGLNRRDMLRRSALVGGALVWAAPAVQALSAPAFATTGSPTPPGDNPCEPGEQLSVVLALLQCGDETFLVKYSPQSGTPGAPDECGTDATLPQAKVNGNGNNTPDNTCIAAMAAIHQYISDHDITLSESGCPSATVDAVNGAICFSSSCTVLAWGIHDGALGQGTHCAYRIGSADIVYGPDANDVVQACDGASGICLNKV